MCIRNAQNKESCNTELLYHAHSNMGIHRIWDCLFMKEQCHKAFCANYVEVNTRTMG